MLIKTAVFSTSVFKLSQLPHESLPEIAFAGKSNVGKSSFINSLLGRKSLARTSKSPGRTQSINFYLINEWLYFVDLPGYGYAKVSIDIKRNWKDLVEGYLKSRQTLKAVAVLLDVRRIPGEQDLSLLEWLKINNLPVIVILTKADKLSRGELKTQVQKLGKSLPFEPQDIITFSAITGAGKTEFWERIMPLISVS